MSDRPFWIADIDDTEVAHADGYLEAGLQIQELGGRWHCRSTTTTRGAINLYRVGSEAFDVRELGELSVLARLVPEFYDLSVERVSYALVKKLNELFIGQTFDETPSEVLQQACQVVADMFNVLEVTVFLENRLKSPGQFVRVASTWPQELGPFPKEVLHADPSEGLTGWVLSHGRPTMLYDLRDAREGDGKQSAAASDLVWKDEVTIESGIRPFLGEGSGVPLPPVTFMAAPIKAEGRVLGVIRCSAAVKSPFLFGKSYLEVLEVLADRIGGAWRHWLSSAELRDQNEVWAKFVDRLGEVNRFVESEIERLVVDKGVETKPDFRVIYAEALGAVDVFEQEIIADVRLYDDVSSELYFDTVRGRAWKEGTPEEQIRRLGRRFPVGDPPESVGAMVMLTGASVTVDDPSNTALPYSPPSNGANGW